MMRCLLCLSGWSASAFERFAPLAAASRFKPLECATSASQSAILSGDFCPIRHQGLGTVLQME
jgi:hypothetical protein